MIDEGLWLRKAIRDASRRPLQYPGLGGRVYEMLTEPQIDAILDAVIGALPKPIGRDKGDSDSDYFYGEGNNHMLREVTKLLESSKLRQETSNGRD